MGARHSIQGQGQVDRRPRSNSVMESNLQPPGPTRRTTSHIQTRHHSERDLSDVDPEEDEGGSNGGNNAGSSSHTIHGNDGNNFRVSMRTSRGLAGLLQQASAAQAAAAAAASNNRTTNERRTLLRLLAGRDVECPVCHKRVPSDDVEVHLVMCFTRPKLVYNEEILTSDRGECSICLDEMEIGNNVARLECLCLFHKECLDEWFKRKNVCPQHPGDE
uniref:RING-type domain-containing protein n=1 Tax=Panagrolaimus sp. ES5 TaxID=591445 RepID=A0AC34GCG9_9BILA